MKSVRLRPDQIARLKETGYGAAIIRHAVMRWKRGDFVIQKSETRKKGSEVLRVFPIREKPRNVEDWQIRACLDAHWSKRDEILQKRIAAEIAELDKGINEMMTLMQKKGYILET